MKKSIFLSIIFGLGILFSVSKVKTNNFAKIGTSSGLLAVLYGINNLRKEGLKMYALCPSTCRYHGSRSCKIGHTTPEYDKFHRETIIPGLISLCFGLGISAVSILKIIKK